MQINWPDIQTHPSIPLLHFQERAAFLFLSFSLTGLFLSFPFSLYLYTRIYLSLYSSGSNFSWIRTFLLNFVNYWKPPGHFQLINVTANTAVQIECLAKWRGLRACRGHFPAHRCHRKGYQSGSFSDKLEIVRIFQDIRSRQPQIVLEIGCGSGVVSTFVNQVIRFVTSWKYATLLQIRPERIWTFQIITGI